MTKRPLTILILMALLPYFTSCQDKSSHIENEVNGQDDQMENVTASHHEYLKELAWMIGDWIDEDEDDGVTIETKNQWAYEGNFILQTFNASADGKSEISGTEYIGWDPIKEEIHTWLFDSDGSFGEGKWHKEGSSWVVEMEQTLADGSKASSVNIYTPLTADTYSWQSEGRVVGGELLPDIDPITIKRKGV